MTKKEISCGFGQIFWRNLSWWRSLSHKKQSINLQSKSVDWFLYDKELRHERVNGKHYFLCNEAADKLKYRHFNLMAFVLEF